MGVCLVAQLCLTLCNSLDCSTLGSLYPWDFQPRILDWVAIFSSRVSSRPRDQTHSSCVSRIAGGSFTHGAISTPVFLCFSHFPPSVTPVNQVHCTNFSLKMVFCPLKVGRVVTSFDSFNHITWQTWGNKNKKKERERDGWINRQILEHLLKKKIHMPKWQVKSQ